MGIHPCAHAPCIFTGTLFEDELLIYIGLYVNNFIYFSPSPKVEQEFEQRLKNEKKMLVDFLGTPTHFLGMRFETLQTNDE
eukprot:12033034-Ditylum_brightwellii.AAC.1